MGIISMVVLCNATVIIEYGRRGSGLPSAPKDVEYGNNNSNVPLDISYQSSSHT